jgi:RNA polymerase sigma factor (sigma-70 family)
MRYPRIPDQEALLDLVQKSIAGDKDATDFIILCHMPYVISIAECYTTDFDETCSIGTLALVEAVSRLSTVTHDKVTGYLKKCVRGACNKVYRKNLVISIPLEKPLNLTRKPLNDSIAVNESFDRLEFDDLITSICQTPKEEAIVSCRKHGMNDQEIAESLGMARKTVSKIRHSLFRRYKRVTQRMV